MSTPTLPKRKIGGTDVTALGYGAMPYDQSTLAEPQTKVRHHEPGCSVTYATVQQFLDEVYARGCTFWDTADIYVNSEQAIGDW